MKSLVKSILISAAAVAMTVAVITPASADDHWHHHHGSSGWAYGAAGLATGLIVGSAIANQPRYYDDEYAASPRYYDDEYAAPPSYYYAPPRRTYYVPVARSLRPWTPAWSRYCYDRYRTFDGRTGTYVGSDGVRHFC